MPHLNKFGYIECDHCRTRFPGISAKYFFLRADKYGLLATCELCQPAYNSPFYRYEEITEKEYMQRLKLEAFR